MSANPLGSSTGLEVLYVDGSAAGRAAFVATHGRVVRVVAAAPEGGLDALDVPLVVVRDRGRATAATLRALAGRHRLLLVPAERVPVALDWCDEGLAEQIVVVPCVARVVAQAILAAARSIEESARADGLLAALLERDRLATVALLRGALLHDLANLTTVASMDVEILRREAAGSSHEDDIETLHDVCRRMLVLHGRSRAASSGLRRQPQVHGIAALLDAATEQWRLLHPGEPALTWTCPADTIGHADRGDFVRVVIGLAELAVSGGCAPHVDVRPEPAGPTVVAEGAAAPGTLPFLLTTRLTELNGGTWTVDGGALACRFPARG